MAGGTVYLAVICVNQTSGAHLVEYGNSEERAEGECAARACCASGFMRGSLAVVEIIPVCRQESTRHWA